MARAAPVTICGTGETGETGARTIGTGGNRCLSRPSPPCHESPRQTRWHRLSRQYSGRVCGKTGILPVSDGFSKRARCSFYRRDPGTADGYFDWS